MQKKNSIWRYIKYALAIIVVFMIGWVIVLLPDIYKHFHRDKSADRIYDTYYPRGCFQNYFVVRDESMLLASFGETIQKSMYYSPNSVLRRVYFFDQGLSLVLREDEEESNMTNQERAQKFFADNYQALEAETWNSQVIQDYSYEDRIDMLSVVWCGKPYHENSSLKMEDLTDEEIDYFIHEFSINRTFQQMIGPNALAELRDYETPIFKR